MVQSVVCEVGMVLVVCIKLDGVRRAGSSAYTACSTRFNEVFRVCVDITQPPHKGRCVVLAMSTTSIVHTSDCNCLYIASVYISTENLEQPMQVSRWDVHTHTHRHTHMYVHEWINAHMHILYMQEHTKRGKYT